MKKIEIKKTIIIIVFGLLLSSIAFPERSQALRNDTFTGEINFNVLMDNGAVIPAGKVPIATVDYGVRRYDYLRNIQWASSTVTLDDYINTKSLTIPYKGAGNYSHSETATFKYGIEYHSTDIRNVISRYHSYSNLKFTNVSNYIRTMSSISSVRGDYSYYTQKTSNYESPNQSTDFKDYLINDMATITNPNLTKTSPGSFKYNGSPTVSYAEHPDSVQFAVSGGAGTAARNIYLDYGYNFSSLSGSNKRVTFFLQPFQAVEKFEDASSVAISPPSGFIQNKKIDADEDIFTHTMNKLPMSYVAGGNAYVLDGWYQGTTKPGTLKTTNPPTITIDYTKPKTLAEFDAEGEIHVVYKKGFTVKEEYIDTKSTSINSGAWNTSTATIQNSTFNGTTPSTYKTDSSGAEWEYQGWKLSTESMSAMRPKSTPISVLMNTNKTIQYVYKKKQHTITEKWVDQADGSTLVPLTGNPKTSNVDDNDHFTGSATATITDKNGAIWDFVGWENVTDAVGVVNPAPAYAVNNIKGGKEIRYHYKARNTTATLDLKPTPQIVMSGGNVAWSSRLTNTGTSTLNNLKLKATSNWASGLSEPAQVTVTPGGGAPQTFTLSPGDWTGGFNLTGITIPNASPNNYADITFSTTATGAVNKVLPAEIQIDGNMANPLKAENFVRIDDPDEPNLEPTGNAGLINIPDFRFGEVEVKPYAHTKGLDKAAYRNNYHPYIRFMDNESTGGWGLSVKLGQFTSGSKTLPTTTSIKLRNGLLMKIQNYNKHNEIEDIPILVGSKTIPSDGTTVALTDGTTQGVYQLEYDINNGVELELMAHSGIAGLSYEAKMDWTLTTAP